MVLRIWVLSSGTEHGVELGFEAAGGRRCRSQMTGDLAGAGADLVDKGLLDHLDHPADSSEVADQDDEEGDDGRHGQGCEQRGHERSARTRCVAPSSWGAAVTVWT